LAFLIAAPPSSWATDEIQVYNAEIAEVGQWTLQQHLNYTAQGRAFADFPGGLVPNHSLNGTPELAYGVADWWELGLYAPFAFDQQGQFFSDAFKVRTLFVSPDAAKRDFFYGVNFEFSCTTPTFWQTRFGAELRPIIGVRNAAFEFIVNPIVDFAPGNYGATIFAPAARLAHKFEKDFYLGLEYYADFGQIGHFSPLNQQQHNLFAVTDFKVGDFDVDLGFGHGFTQGSDRLIFKAIHRLRLPRLQPRVAHRALAEEIFLSERRRKGRSTQLDRHGPSRQSGAWQVPCPRRTEPRCPPTPRPARRSPRCPSSTCASSRTGAPGTRRRCSGSWRRWG
jgi:hypothetical protein